MPLHLGRALGLVLLLFWAPAAVAQILIDGVTVIPMTGAGPQSDFSVLVRDGRIAAVGPRQTLSDTKAERTIDGRGLYLIPGLADMHGHVPSPTRAPDEARDTLFLFLAHGVTTVRNMLAEPGHLGLRERIAREEIWAPTLQFAGHGFSGNVANVAEAIARVERQKAEGWDLLKIFDGISLEEFDAVAARARDLDIPFAGHVPRAVGLERVLNSGMRTIEHLDGYILALDGEGRTVPEEDLRHLSRLTKAAGVGVVPTLAVWEHLLFATAPDVLEAYEELAYVSRKTQNAWRARLAKGTETNFKRTIKQTLGIYDPAVIADNRLRLLKAMDEDGVEILFGTDSPQYFSVPGFSVLREALRMQVAGLSNRRILETATVDAGAYFAPDETFGTVEPGSRADLVLLGSDPLRDLNALRDIRGVMVRGRWLSAQEIAEGLADIRGRAAAE